MVIQIFTILLVVSRYIKQAAPLWALLPVKWQWLPSAVISAIAIVTGLGVPTTPDAWVAMVLAVAVDVALAWQRGYHA